MNLSQVEALLQENKDERGISYWKKNVKSDLKTYGIGLTKLRKLAKQIGRNHALALELWFSDNHDIKTIALLIDDPKKITREQVEAQVEDVNHGYLAHVFSSCGASLGKRNLKLNKVALKVAKKIGLIYFNDDGNCEPFDVVRHLTSDYLKKKFAD